jgi:hypothetical protein
MARRSVSFSGGTCDECRSDHDHGWRHRRPRVPRTGRSGRAQSAPARSGLARHTPRTRGAARAATRHRDRMDHDRRCARPRLVGLGSGSVSRCGGRRRGAARATSAPTRRRARHGRLRRRTGRHRRMAHPPAIAHPRAEFGGRHDEPPVGAVRHASLRGVPRPSWSATPCAARYKPPSRHGAACRRATDSVAACS